MRQSSLPGARVVRSDRAFLLVEVFAALQPGDDLPAYNEARRGVRESLFGIGHRDIPGHRAAPRIERHDVSVAGVHENSILVDAQTAQRPELMLLTRIGWKLASVLPQQLAGRGIQCLDRAAGVCQIHDAVMNERRRLLVASLHRPRPGKTQLPDVLPVDLVERAVSPAVVGATRVKPIRSWRIGQDVVGDPLEGARTCIATLLRHCGKPARRGRSISYYPAPFPRGDA